MTNLYLAPHETYKLHELLTFKTLCVTKSAIMSGLVQDQELKSILEQDITKTKDQIKRMTQVMVAPSVISHSPSSLYEHTAELQ